MNKLLVMTKFEIKNNLFRSNNWIMALAFMFINMLIIPFTISTDVSEMRGLYLPTIMSSLLLGLVLLTNQYFDEDVTDGTIAQLQASGVSLEIIFLAKSFAICLVLNLILLTLFTISSLIYGISFLTVLSLWVVSLFFTPILTSLSVFGSMLTFSLKKNNLLSIILVFPLFISVLIIYSMGVEQIVSGQNFSGAFSFIGMSFGITVILVPMMCFLVKHLR